jgi:diaminohydroxyphosphoribosylaminopyrimidine deaminase / 5-amino-6-(5-phosphoribosylamino)uracil reductase
MKGRFDSPEAVMRHALLLARRGVGCVEPNPPVGAVIVDEQLQFISGGCHERFGGPHAEVHAIQQAGDRCRGASLYVTLEPCAHHGRTPPCTEAVIAAGITEVVMSTTDPAPHTNGGGLARLRDAGLSVRIGLLEDEGRRLIAPFRKLVVEGLPWVHAKWAMSWDGRIATRSGDSKWISSDQSRAIVHELRGRMDAILIGRGTALADDPLLTARPPGPRTATRIVVDSRGELPLDSQLVQTAGEAPVMLVTLDTTPAERLGQFTERGVEVVQMPATGDADRPQVDLLPMLRELGSRQVTHLLVEGGATLLGSLFDAGLVDECHVFVAPMIVGGSDAPAAVAGRGVELVAQATMLGDVEIQHVGDDVYLRGRVAH